jgi:peptidoglycan LD-endopeptidase CwlK
MATCTLDYLLARSNKTLDGVHAYLREKAIELVNTAYNQGIRIAVTSGYRSNEEQAEKYGQGRAHYIYNGKDYGSPRQAKVSNAKPGTSFHNFGLAFDVTLFDEDKNPIWNDLATYRKVGKMGQKLGLTWGADWDGDGSSADERFIDLPHFQHDFGLSLAQLRDGAKPPRYVAESGNKAPSPSNDTASKPASSGAIVPYPGHLVQKGDKGKDVERIQRAVGFKGKSVDGDFGTKTEDAVKKYQRRHYLDADGIVGPETWEMMF